MLKQFVTGAALLQACRTPEPREGTDAGGGAAPGRGIQTERLFGPKIVALPSGRARCLRHR